MLRLNGMNVMMSLTSVWTSRSPQWSKWSSMADTYVQQKPYTFRINAREQAGMSAALFALSAGRPQTTSYTSLTRSQETKSVSSLLTEGISICRYLRYRSAKPIHNYSEPTIREPVHSKPRVRGPERLRKVSRCIQRRRRGMPGKPAVASVLYRD